jgi:manganese transport protein
LVYGENIEDHETLVDEKITRRIQSDSFRKGFKVAIQLGFGKPDKVIPEM